MSIAARVYALEAEGADVCNGMVRCSNGHARRWLDTSPDGTQACPECGKKYRAIEIAVEELGVAPKWRQGSKVGRTLYLDDKLVGLVDSQELAAEIVAAMNRGA